MSDKDDEVAELRARLAALETSRSAYPPPPYPPPPPPGPGCMGWAVIIVLGAIGLFAALAAIGGHERTESQAPSPGAPGTSADFGVCDQAWSRKYVRHAERLGIIRDLGVQPDGVVALVSASGWVRQPIDTQKTMAAAIDCSIAGQGKDLKAVHFRLTLSGQDLYGLDAGELLGLRTAGYAKGDSKP